MNVLRSLLTIFALLVATTATPANAEIVFAESLFSSDLDGWTMPDISIEWRGSGGNPNGYMDWEDSRFVTNDNSFAFAPAKFLGDWTALNNVGTVSFDHRLFSTGTPGVVQPYEIVIGNPTNSARWTLLGDGNASPWLRFNAPIRESEWEVLSGTWQGVLADVDSMAIRTELILNPSGSPLGDTAGLDNIRVTSVPEPSALAFLALGGTILAGVRLRRTEGSA